MPTKETQDMNEVFEKQKTFENIQDLKALCETEEEFKDLTLKLSLLEVIIQQVNDVFTSSLYNPDTGTTLIEASQRSVKIMQENLTKEYIKNSVESGMLAHIPGIEDACEWVTEIHESIASQLYSDGFIVSVFAPALQTLQDSIIEFSKEEQEALDSQEETSGESNDS
jgi:hypothetical protein